MNLDDDSFPKSWSKEERYLLVQLPPAVREVITRRAKIDSNALRKAQNEAADLRHKLATFEKENCSAEEV